MDELLSVVVTVYNIREYLQKCICSIENQTYSNLEIILVDDGSDDGSSELCDQFILKDKRIVVIHKENEGVVSARKVGLERARGEYVIIIDGDDWIEPNMILELHDFAVSNSADIVTSGCRRESGNIYTDIIDGIRKGVYSSREDWEYIYHNLIYTGVSEENGITPMLYNKLIKTSLVRSLHLQLSKMIYYGEDAAVIYGCCMQAKTIVITHNIYYHYIMRSGSATSNSNPYYLRSANELYLFLKSNFELSQYKTVLIQQLDVYITKQILLGFSYYMGLSQNVSIPYYDFDKNVIEKNARIVLYGAGKVGQAFYKQICADRIYHLVGWVDNKYLEYRKRGMNVHSIDVIRQVKFDYIILAFIREDMAEMVRKSLIETYEIETNKIIWLTPVTIVDKYRLIEESIDYSHYL